MDNLINKFLNNDLTTEESERLKLWIQTDVRNRVEFENIIAHLNHSDLEFKSLKDKVYNKIISDKDQAQSGKKVGRERGGQRLQFFMKVAAVFIFLITSVVILLDYQTKKEEVSLNPSDSFLVSKEAALGQKLMIKLPDGTIVKLNSGSRLTYPEVFDQHERKVELEGEAFFDVVPNIESPFRIKTNTLKIKVVGTSFNVRSYQEDNAAAVGVMTGTVSVSTMKGTDEVVLEPSQMALYDNTSSIISKDTILFSNAVFGWMEKELVFNETSFDQVLTELSRWYGVDFKIEGKFDSDQRLTSLYKNPTLKSVLTSLSYVYGYNFEIYEKSVKIMKN